MIKRVDSDSAYTRATAPSSSAAAQPAGPPRRQGLPLPSLLAFTLTSFIATANESVPAGLLPHIAVGLGITQAAAGQLVTCCALGSGLAAIPLTALTAGAPRRRLLILALTVFLAGNALTAMTDSYALALFARFAIGLATGVTWSLLAGYARRLVPPEQKGSAMALAMAGIPLALALGMPLGSWLGALAGWRSVFYALAAVAAALIASIYAAVPEFPGDPARSPRRLPAVLAAPGIPAILTVLALWILAHYLLYTYIAPMLAWLGFAPSLEQVLLVFGLSAVIGNWLVGLLIDRWLRGLVLACLTAFATAAAVLFLAHAAPVLMYAAISVWGLSFGGAPTLLQTALADRAGENADAAQAILVTVFNLAFAVSGALGGVLLQSQGAGVLPAVVIALLMIAAAVAWQATAAGFPRASLHPVRR